MKNEFNKEYKYNLILDSEIQEECEEYVPALYQVVVHNDDFTPMEFVVGMLEKFFYMDRSKAADTMLEAHQKGYAVCGLYSQDVADSKIQEVISYARSNEHPLNCSKEVA